MTRMLPLLLVLGCGSLLPAASAVAPPSREVQVCLDRCRQTADDPYLAWHAVGLVGSAISTASGVGGAIAAGVADRDDAADWSMGLLITSAAGGLLSTVGNWLAGEYAVREAACVAACGAGG